MLLTPIARQAWLRSTLQSPQLTIAILSLFLRTTTSLLLLLTSRLLPDFRTDATPLDPSLTHSLSPYLHPFIRWDAVHFVHIALGRQGYVQEERSVAFMPFLPILVMREGGRVLAWLSGRKEAGVDDIVVAGIVASVVATTGAALLLYRLTLRLFPPSSSSPSAQTSSYTFALLTSALFLFAPSRPTLHAAPYTEPFAAFFTFLGMYLLYSPRRSVGSEIGAALAWALGSSVRAQGTTLGVGFFGWRYLLQRPSVRGRFSATRLLSGFPIFLLLSFLSALPFLLFQRYVYTLYCLPDSLKWRPWCAEGVGMSYGWVQREYWNVRPFAYWRPLQLPNFLLAAPVLFLAFFTSFTFYRAHWHLIIRQTLPFLPQRMLATLAPSSPPSAATRHHPLSLSSDGESIVKLIPLVHLSFALSLLLLTTAHVQIALRVCVCDPVVWWSAARLVLNDFPELGAAEVDGERETGDDGKVDGYEHRGEGKEGGKREMEKRKQRAESEKRRRWGEVWVWYCVGWGTLATVLYGAWLPPA